MNREGAPTTTEVKITYSEVLPTRRLAYLNRVDFVPGVDAYEVATQVDLVGVPDGVRMILKFDAMHDELWTQRQAMGWESEVGKLAKVLAKR